MYTGRDCLTHHTMYASVSRSSSTPGHMPPKLDTFAGFRPIAYHRMAAK